MRAFDRVIRVGAVVAVGFLATACTEQSRVDPDAEVRIEGRAVQPDGAPLAGRPVRMGSDVTGGEALTAVLTLGLSCVGRGCGGTPLTATTGDDGSFSFTVKGRKIKSAFGEARRQLLATSAAPSGQHVSGAAVSASFRVQTATVRLPPLHLVDPGLTVAIENDLTAKWAGGKPGPYELMVETDELVPVWRVTTTAGDATLDRRVLELDAGRVVVAGRTADAIEGSEVELRWRSPGIGIAGAGSAPPSRGRPCRYVTPSGKTVDQPTCRLTDGQLGVSAAVPLLCPEAAAPSTTAPTSCERPTFVDVALGDAVRAELIVVRGCEQSCGLSVSTDGESFVDVGRAATEFATLPLDGSPITTVRLGLPAGPRSEVREVSVWAARPQPRGAAGESAIDELRDAFAGGTSNSSTRRVVVVLAAALLAAVLLSTGFALGRLRPRLG